MTSDKLANPASPISMTHEAICRRPFPAYEALRAEGPVYRDPVSGHYILTRYADVRAALLNTRALSNSTGLSASGSRQTKTISDYVEKHGWPLTDALGSTDAPVHTTHRASVAKALAAPVVSALEPHIAAVVSELLDKIIGRGEVDFFAAYAVPLPLRMTAELIGFKDADPAKLREWTLAMVELTNPIIAPEREGPLSETLVEMQTFIFDNLERVRAAPDDTILGRLAKAAEEERIGVPAVLNIVSQLNSAGLDTTTSALTSGLKCLIENPLLADGLRATPADIPAFIEEVLRLESPIQTLFRRATADVEVTGTVIPQGSIVEARYGAANRDPEIFPRPDAIDPSRENLRSHLAFGVGPHVCIGNQLARAELRISFEQLLSRTHALRFTRGADSYAYEDGYVTYGCGSLMCELT